MKRLIEVALPLKEVSEQSAREKSIRHGHISTLHIWWARRPLAACRAVVFASLIPDPDDPECPATFRQLVRDTLAPNEFRPKNGNGSTVEDTPRNRCLEFIKHLVKWENSNNPTYIEPARTLIAAAHKLLHPDAQGEAPKVLDPFAGGGAIPLEALRLGCESHAVDLNPVAHLIELCTLVYPQRYGQPDSRPVPEYIMRLIAHNKAKKKAKSGSGLFDGQDDGEAATGGDLIPDVEITEAEYRKNPLAADVEYWGHWVLEQARREIGQFYPADEDGSVPVAYLWARTVTCPNPACGATIPLVRQLWLCKKAKRKVAMRLVLDTKTKGCRFEVVEGKHIDFDPEKGTMKQGKAACPFCSVIVDGKTLRTESKAKRMGQQMMAVVTTKAKKQGKSYRLANRGDETAYKQAAQALEAAKAKYSQSIVPEEPISKQQPRVMFVTIYGLTRWCDVFNDRQLLTLLTLVRYIRAATDRFRKAHDEGYADVVACNLALALDRAAESDTNLSRWIPAGEKPAGAYSRQALPMIWDYCEVNLLEESPRQFSDSLDWVGKCIVSLAKVGSSFAHVARCSAMALPMLDRSQSAVVTDPPYYDAVPYADLSDFFYVWMKRTVGHLFPDDFRTPLTPKTQELIEERPHKSLTQRKDQQHYEQGMSQAFGEIRRVLSDSGLSAVMFAHKTTSAWETLIASLLKAGLEVTTSWPFHTERPGRLRAQSSAALASSVTLVCRKRHQDASDGLWDDVRRELQQVARERLDFFWSQHIRGADFFISAIGPALSVFGRYARVVRLSGEEVTVGQFLDEVRALVTNYALDKILRTKQTASIDAESRFAVVWKWSYGAAKVPADEAFKLAQGLGFDTEQMWGRAGVLVKSGENVQIVPVEKRMKIKNLGEPGADNAPASLIDVLHRMCAFRENGDLPGMAQFLNRSRQIRNASLWVVAQAVSEILPEGDKEKQLMQGLLNQREQIEEEARQGGLFGE
jgi:adenine-specific DNA methylase